MPQALFKNSEVIGRLDQNQLQVRVYDLGKSVYADMVWQCPFWAAARLMLR